MIKSIALAAVLFTSTAASASTTTITFDGQTIEEIVATGPWWVGYYLDGNLFADVAYGAGDWLATELPLQSGWSTDILTRSAPDELNPAGSLVTIAESSGFLAFTDPPSGGRGSAVPEASTWVMLVIGMASLAYASFRRRVGRLA